MEELLVFLFVCVVVALVVVLGRVQTLRQETERLRAAGSHSHDMLSEQVQALTRRLAALETPSVPSAGQSTPSPPLARQSTPAPQPLPSTAVPSPAAEPREAPVAPAPQPAHTPVTAAPGHSNASTSVERLLGPLLLGDNPVARAGVLVLLIGVALSLRLAAQQGLFPVEARLVCVAIFGGVLGAFGYRQRHQRVTFARLLQGAGTATLYLVVFFAYRFYGLLPAPWAFALLVAIALSSGVLAVLQDALALVFVGTVGGFAAPLLASSGEANHVGLFSYYLLLNGLVLGVAWFKRWRLLTLTGFVATFGVGTSWGVLGYEPDKFASTEPFLVAFFSIYLAINTLDAWRVPRVSGAPVSSSLTFGLPLVAMALQIALAGERDWLVALSALTLAAVYYALARALLARGASEHRLLIEGYLAMAVALATLSVPYAIDGSAMIAATWILEAAALYWVGARSDRWLARAAALLLLAVGVVTAAADDVWGRLPDDSLPVLNPGSLTALLLLATALFMSLVVRRVPCARMAEEKHLTSALLVGALLTCALAAANEVEARVAQASQVNAYGLVVALGCGVLAWFGWRQRLPSARVAGLAIVPMNGGLLLHTWSHDVALWEHLGALTWPGVALALAVVLHLQGRRVTRINEGAHFLAALWASGLAALLARDLVVHVLALGGAFRAITWAGAFACAFIALDSLCRGPHEPFSLFVRAYRGASHVVALLVLLGWVNLLAQSGNAPPLPFLPLVNPVELMSIALWLLLLRAFRRELRALGAASSHDERPGYALFGAAAFVFVTVSLARAIHHFGDVGWSASAMLRSDAFQVSVSLLWAFIGLSGAVVASRRGVRALWLVSACLLGVVVGKLFLIDLSSLDALLRVLSFLGVGILLLAVGYMAPLPPERD